MARILGAKLILHIRKKKKTFFLLFFSYFLLVVKVLEVHLCRNGPGSRLQLSGACQNRQQVFPDSRFLICMFTSSIVSIVLLFAEVAAVLMCWFCTVLRVLSESLL